MATEAESLEAVRSSIEAFAVQIEDLPRWPGTIEDHAEWLFQLLWDLNASLLLAERNDQVAVAEVSEKLTHLMDRLRWVEGQALVKERSEAA
jgi:hypothetical protein